MIRKYATHHISIMQAKWWRKLIIINVWQCKHKVVEKQLAC